MNAWGVLKDQLLAGLEQIRVDEDQMPADVPAWVAATTLDQNEQADRAVIQWIQTSRWPECSLPQRTLLFLRLWRGAEQARSREIRADPTPDLGAEQLHLRAFLIGDWYEFAVRWSRVRFQEHRPGDSLRWTEN